MCTTSGLPALGMVAATAEQRRVTDVQLELVHVANPRDQRVELSRRNVADAAAMLAHKMAMRARQVEERWPVRLVHVLHELPVAQGVEGPVNGGEMNLRMRIVNLRREIVGGEMVGGVREQLHHESTRGRDAAAFDA